MKRLLFLLNILLALSAAGVSPAAAWAQEDEIPEIDNAAIAINTEDGASIFDLAFSIRDVAGDVVDETNAAVAFNQCEDCRSVAVAIQIVLVAGHPSVVTPENAAVALNYQCTLCEALAMAYQFVIGVPDGFHFSGEAMSEIKRLRNEIRKLLKDDQLAIPELRARIDELADRLRQVIREDIARYAERQRQESGQERAPPPPVSPPPPAATTEPTETETETAPTVTNETTTTETDTTTGTTTQETTTEVTTTTP